jgi:hydrogenase/urease accessory protein HupE
MSRALIFVGFVLAALAALPVQAHNAGVSTSRLAIRDRTVNVEINALGLDYEKAASVRLIELKSGVVNAVALAVMAPSVLTYVGDHIAVLASGRSCLRTAATARPADTHVLVTIALTCPSGGGDLRYRVTLFQDVDPAARHVAVIATEHGDREFVLDRTAPEIDLSGAGSSTLQLVGRFIRAGIEHIFLGYDHIAFLLAVILWSRSLWPLVKVVTAFTLAHSLTLCLAVLDIVRLPSSVVEPLIAATIVFVAAENFFVHDIRKRWRVTFVLGLVHGFGFAGALREYGLPTDAVAPALAAFNIGVEIGQVAIVGLVFPLLLLSDRIGGGAAIRKQRHPVVVYTCSAAILACGLYWLMQRTVFA